MDIALEVCYIIIVNYYFVLGTVSKPTLYCFCQREEFGDMIACDNNNCKIQWFHFECVNLTNTPKGRWFCKNCI